MRKLFLLFLTVPSVEVAVSDSVIFFQLFKRAHPPKRVFRSVESDTQTGTLVNVDRLFFHNLPNLVPSAQPVKGQWKSPNHF